MQSPPRIESIPCPTCHEKQLKLRQDGNGAECAACGQWVVFDEGPGKTGKRRNYTPDRGMKKLATGIPASPPPSQELPKTISRFPKIPQDPPAAPAPRAGEQPPFSHGKLPPLKSPSENPPPGHHPHGHPGPMPVFHDTGEEKPIIIPSQALETVTRAGCFRRFLILVVLALMGVAAYWVILHHQRSLEAAATVPVKEIPAHPLLSDATDPPPGDAEVAEAREFLQGKILAAGTWKDLVAHVRLRETVEPLMREYYAANPFKPLGEAKITGSRMVHNGAGRFAVFVLSSADYPVAMVEVGTDGPKLDWETLVNYPLRAWLRFLNERPVNGVDLAVTVTRGYMREDYLTAEEKSRIGRLIGVWVGMPGSDVRLFATVNLESDIGRWISTSVPWEHENKTTLIRAGLAFDPKHRLFPARATLTSQPIHGWNRPKPPPPDEI